MGSLDPQDALTYLAGNTAIALLLLVIVVLLVLILLLIVARALGFIDVKLTEILNLHRGDGRAKVKLALAEVALKRHEAVFKAYVIAAEGLPLALDDRSELAVRLRKWVDEVCSGMTQCLASNDADCYRVAVWWDDPKHPMEFQRIGRSSGVFRGNRKVLPKAMTGAGSAFADEAGFYRCPDTKDPFFKHLGGSLGEFQSMYALAMGSPGKPRWGVLTVDFGEPEGFDPDRVRVITRFGDLINVAILAWSQVLVGDGPADDPADVDPPKP